MWQSERGIVLPTLEETTLHIRLDEEDVETAGPPNSPLLPRIKIPAEIMTHLRSLAKRQPIRLRPSIKFVFVSINFHTVIPVVCSFRRCGI